VVREAAADRAGLDAGIEACLGNIHSTNVLHHGNLPCACDCDPTTVRSYVTTAKIPGSPTVVAGGVSGDIAARFGRWPPAKALSRFHRTFCSMCRYKGFSSTKFLRSAPSPGSRSLRAQSSLRRLRKLVCDASHPLPQG